MLKHGAGHRAIPSGFFWLFSMSQPANFPLFPGKTAVVMVWRLRIYHVRLNICLFFLYALNDLQTFHPTFPVHEHYPDTPHPYQAFRARHSRIKL
jgi:hypothetical protein